jgi:serine/threonine protein kinase
MPKKCFSIVTTINFGIQSLEALEILHDQGFIHRDVKLANFMVGRGAEGAGKVYLIDFGLVKVYCTRDGELYPVFFFFFFFIDNINIGTS